MKFAISLVLLISVGCNFKHEQPNTPAADYKRFDPIVVGPEDQARLKVICEAIESLEERLPVLVSSPYTFAYAEKSCAQTDIGAATDVRVTLQRPDFNYIFRKSSGDALAFPVETTSSGSMAVICENLHDLRSPLQTSSKGAMWFTTFASTRHCSSSHDTMCVQIQWGEDQGNMNYLIHTSEWITFKVRDDKRGFYVERKLISDAGCAAGQTIERRAKLK